MIETNWDPSREDPMAPGPKFAKPELGVTWEQQQSQMYREWVRFEARLEERSVARHYETGLGMSDAEKSSHRRKFERVMGGLYGAAYPDARWAEEHEQRARERQDQDARERRR